MTETSFDDVIAEAEKTDAQHEAMLAMQAELADLRRKNAIYETPANAVQDSIGGKPVPHHLHLVDGRVIANHEGIGTHFSEIVNGEEVVTRVAAHYPVREVHPNQKYA
jgi:hypothetical protein